MVLVAGGYGRGKAVIINQQTNEQAHSVAQIRRKADGTNSKFCL